MVAQDPLCRITVCIRNSWRIENDDANVFRMLLHTGNQQPIHQFSHPSSQHVIIIFSGRHIHSQLQDVGRKLQNIVAILRRIFRDLRQRQHRVLKRRQHARITESDGSAADHKRNVHEMERALKRRRSEPTGHNSALSVAGADRSNFLACFSRRVEQIRVRTKLLIRHAMKPI